MIISSDSMGLRIVDLAASVNAELFHRLDPGGFGDGAAGRAAGAGQWGRFDGRECWRPVVYAGAEGSPRGADREPPLFAPQIGSRDLPGCGLPQIGRASWR